MDPNDLRDCVEREIVKLIEPVAWQRCEVVNRAEQESLRTILGSVGARMTKLTLECVGWKPLRRNTLVGFARSASSICD